jgi:two-component system cell cycle sensor histidine kinase/response regulator CckA
MKKTLVVDNNLVMLQLMKKLLEKEGHEVLTAADGLSALEILKTCIPDVMFIDLIMPDIDGEKLCKIVRKIPELNHVYIVIISAIAVEQHVDPAQLGANACIAKGPFDEMRQNVLVMLDKLQSGDSYDVPAEVLGTGNLHKREITEELLISKKHFELILGSMSEGILEITKDARVVYANPSAVSMIGIPEEKLLTCKFTDVFYEKDQHRTKEILETMYRKEKRIPEHFSVKLNERKLSTSILPIKEERDRFIIILSDITEQERLESRLQQAQKMEAIGTLAGGIAHDFNNLLMGVQGNVSLMLMDISSTHPHHKRLKNIEKQVQSGARLTSHLLGYARKGRYEVKPVDLNQLVEETSGTFGRTRREITILRDLAEDLFGIEADPGQIEQVLLNLFVNAADAMPEGGDLSLKTMNVTHNDMKGKPYDPKPGNYVVMKVTDTGSGMDKETMGRIFDPFFTTKEMGRGTGLGLASAYGIIKGHGGYIDVDSKKGQGATFSIYLPALEKKVQRSVKSPEQFIKTTGTVLLVDDEEVVLEVGKELLEAMGYMVLIARDGKEAIEVYGRNPDDIDLVLLDMVMPEMCGGETYDRMKGINPDIKVLLSSGYSIDGKATEILERGCDGFIQKPFTMKELSRKLMEILEKE